MKSVLSALIIFSVLITITSCHDKNTTQESTPETQVTTTVSSSDTTSQVSSAATAAAISSETSSSGTEQTALPDISLTGLSMTEQMTDSDYMEESPIPSVAWTEINLDKTMYAQSQCIGYEFALSDAHAKMTYDAGIALEIIARTSTGYYRTTNDYYIPCDYLDNNVPENVDPAVATSCTVAPPVTTTVSSSVIVSAVSSTH